MGSSEDKTKVDLFMSRGSKRAKKTEGENEDEG